MFVVLGLLSFPSRLLDVAPQGLLIAIVLIFVARPLAVVTAVPFGYDWREMILIAWTGLKGAVPITLATFPLLLGVPRAPLLFDVVFFVVLMSALLQGIGLPYLARKLKLELPAEPTAPVSLEITSLKQVDGDIVDFTLAQDSRAAGRPIRELALPDGVVIAMVARGESIIPPKGSTVLLPGDHVFVVLKAGLRTLVDRVFSRRPEVESEPLPAAEFPLRAATRVADIREYYGIELEAPPEMTLADLFRRGHPDGKSQAGTRLQVGDISLVVREVTTGGDIELIGLDLGASGNALDSL
jgi:cell volume regulation protein A